MTVSNSYIIYFHL